MPTRLRCDSLTLDECADTFVGKDFQQQRMFDAAIDSTLSRGNGRSGISLC